MQRTIELTNIEHGVTTILTYEQCVERFGKDEFAEILAGYLPQWIAIEVDREKVIPSFIRLTDES